MIRQTKDEEQELRNSLINVFVKKMKVRENSFSFNCHKLSEEWGKLSSDLANLTVQQKTDLLYRYEMSHVVKAIKLEERNRLDEVAEIAKKIAQMTKVGDKYCKHYFNRNSQDFLNSGLIKLLKILLQNKRFSEFFDTIKIRTTDYKRRYYILTQLGSETFKDFFKMMTVVDNATFKDSFQLIIARIFFMIYKCNISINAYGNDFRKDLLNILNRINPTTICPEAQDHLKIVLNKILDQHKLDQEEKERLRKKFKKFMGW